jgi:hypothetical protein
MGLTGPGHQGLMHCIWFSMVRLGVWRTLWFKRLTRGQLVQVHIPICGGSLGTWAFRCDPMDVIATDHFADGKTEAQGDSSPKVMEKTRRKSCVGDSVTPGYCQRHHSEICCPWYASFLDKMGLPYFQVIPCPWQANSSPSSWQTPT